MIIVKKKKSTLYNIHIDGSYGDVFMKTAVRRNDSKKVIAISLSKIYLNPYSCCVFMS